MTWDQIVVWLIVPAIGAYESRKSVSRPAIAVVQNSRILRQTIS
jgi:hypothetical protein